MRMLRLMAMAKTKQKNERVAIKQLGDVIKHA